MGRKPTLKQFGDLMPADFEKHPVWISVHGLDSDEPWYADTDEETFRPWTGKLPVGPEEGMLLVRAMLTLADGRVLPGFVTPQFESQPLDLGTIQPQIFLPSGRRDSFWDGIVKRDPKRLKAFYAELGEDPRAIFPIQFAAEKGLAKGQVAGSVPGFCWSSKDKVKVYK